MKESFIEKFQGTYTTVVLVAGLYVGQYIPANWLDDLFILVLLLLVFVLLFESGFGKHLDSSEN